MRVYKQKKTNVVVFNGQALTPAQMDEMRQRGTPISPSNVDESLFYDGDVNPKFEVSLADRRGVDIAEIWQQAKTSQKKMRGYNKTQESADVQLKI